jgi:opacity protein-like surface antigen
MKSKLIAAAVLATIASQPAMAQEWSGAQSEVWSAVSNAWKTHAPDGSWANALDPAGFGWDTEYPVPNSRDQMTARAAIFGKETKLLYHRVDPIRIAVNGDTAIAYYFANVVETNHEGKRETRTERCADTLIKRGGSWRFLGWLCDVKSSSDKD